MNLPARQDTPSLRNIFGERGFLALLAFGAFFYHRVIFFGEVFYFRDLYLYFVPFKDLAASVVRSGEVPFWNPYLHGGVPFLADISHHLLYPPNLIYLLLPAWTALSWTIVLHGVAAAGAAYAVARQVGLRPAAACLTGTIYGYAGPTLSDSNLLIRFLGTPWIPLLVLAVHYAMQRFPRSDLRGSLRAWAPAAVCGAMLPLSGAPEMVVFGFVTALAWGLALPGERSWRQVVGVWFLLGAVSAALAAVQIVPLLDLVRGTERGAGVTYTSFSGFSLHPARLPELVVPGFFGRPDTLVESDYWGSRRVDGAFPYLVSLYLGALTPLLAAFGAALGASPLPRRLRTIFAALAAVALLGALGRFLPGFEWIYAWVPGIQLFRFPIKLMALFAFPVALLAGAGAQALAESQARQARYAAAGLAVIFGALAVLGRIAVSGPGLGFRMQELFFAQASLGAAEGLRAAFDHAAVVTLAGVAAWLLADLASRRHGEVSRRLVPAFAVLMAADLWVAGGPAMPTAPREILTTEPPVVAAVRGLVEQGATASGRLYRAPRPEVLQMPAPPSTEIIWRYRYNQELLSTYLAAGYGIPVIYHEDPSGLAPERVIRLKTGIEAMSWGRRLTLLSSAAVRAVLTHEDLAVPGLEPVAVFGGGEGSTRFTVYRNALAAERIRLIYQWIVVDGEDAAIRALVAPGFDPRRHAVVEHGVEGTDPPAVTASRAGEVCDGALRVEIDRPHHRALDVTSDCAAMVVLADGWSPGWRAWVDGEAVAVHRADFAFSAVAVPAGEHRVVWRWAPPSLRLGLLLTLLTSGVGVALLWIPRHRRHGSEAPGTVDGS